MGKIKKFFLSLIILLLFSCNFANAKTIKKKTYKITSSNKSKLNQLIGAKDLVRPKSFEEREDHSAALELCADDD